MREIKGYKGRNMNKRRFNSNDFNDYGINGEKVVIGLDDVKEIIKKVIKKELVDKLENEIKKQLIKKLGRDE